MVKKKLNEQNQPPPNPENKAKNNNACGWQRPAVAAIGFLMILRTYQLNAFSSILSSFSPASVETFQLSSSNESSSLLASPILKNLLRTTITTSDGSMNEYDTDDVKVMIPSGLQTELCDSNNLVTKEIMSVNLVRKLVKEWYVASKYELNKEVIQLREDLELARKNPRYGPRAGTAFADLGRFLYEHAIVRKQLLLTVQAGGMDGWSNDPLFQMFVIGNTDANRLIRVEKQHQPTAFNNNNQSSILSSLSSGLQYWLPVVMEPMPHNYNNLKKTYADIQNQHNLTCPLLSPWAISYNKDNTGCSFCHINVSTTAPQSCHELADWMKYQLSTMDCPYFKRFFVGHPQCWVEASIPCGSITSLLQDSFHLPTAAVPAILQMDIEGYETHVLPAMLESLSDAELPPIIHYEHKVMRKLDQEANTYERHQPVLEAMAKRGYFMINDGEDMLCLLV